MEKVTKEVAKKVVDELKLDIEKALAKQGLTLSSMNTKYGDIFQLKIEAESVKLGKNGVNVNSVYAQNFLNYGYSFGITKADEDLGSIVSMNGSKFIISGLNPKKRSAPVICKNVKTGDEFYVSTKILEKLPSYSR